MRTLRTERRKEKMNKKKPKIKRIYYRFSLIEGKERDMEVMAFLSSIPKPLMGELIIQAIMLLMDAYDFKKQSQG